MARDPNYVVGRGKLFFDQFLPGTKTLSGNERYLGNSPDLTTTQSEEKLEHYSSDYGLKVKDESVSLSNDQSGSFTLDDISKENLALWFRSTGATSTVITGGAVVAEPHANVLLGTYIQLGASDTDPIGARNVSAVVVKIGSTTITPSGNYEVDAVTGRVFILEDPADVTLIDGADITIGYTAAAGTEETVISGGETIQGLLRFISDNAAGENRDYVWPFVKVRPDGDLALKGDDWQKMTFSLEILKLNDSTARQYITKR